MASVPGSQEEKIFVIKYPLFSLLLSIFQNQSHRIVLTLNISRDLLLQKIPHPKISRHDNPDFIIGLDPRPLKQEMRPLPGEQTLCNNDPLRYS